ncbi:MAG: phosphopantothenate/pantothenate synthetase [Nanoarchaeota archaeon]|nr:phosphopantothenate/pantothenate synthetase [Nanoarchaeota archaeon]MBU1946994.1 phosphopantothenate/pantothenate synthetase [Nanoarchaeota archaeon]
MGVPKSHPRYLSLRTRDMVVKGVEKGITSVHGLIAHGRGEAFDYLIGEKTSKFAFDAIEAAACLLLAAKHPVISVNGNAAALCAKELVELSKVVPAKLEVNIFHASKKRELAIALELKKKGAKEVLLPHKGIVKYIEHNRKYCNEEGIAKADVVFVPLEDGDRCLALRRMGKKVITVDLNPLSRTSKSANITIVDNIVRAVPLLIKSIKRNRPLNKNLLKIRIRKYNNKNMLKESLDYILKNLS